MKSQKVFLTLKFIKELEEKNENLAIKVVTNPKVDVTELCHLIEASNMGKFTDPKTKRPLRLNETVTSKAMVHAVALIKLTRKLALINMIKRKI